MTTHVDDGTLIRVLDRECEPDELAEARGHLDACDDCAGRLARFRQQSSALSLALRTADRPARPARPAPRWGLRAAAAILVMLAVGGAVRPVRAWIIERAVALWSALGGGSPDAAPPAPAGPRETAVAFVPAAGTFTVELNGAPAGGRLVVEAVGGDTARAVVLEGGGDEALMVLPSGLRITAPAGSRATYRLRLPARLGPVPIRIADQAVREFDPARSPLQIELRPR
jgi:hypothetical protein